MTRLQKNSVWLGVILVPALLGGAGLGWGLRFDLPDVGALENYTPPLSTRVLAADSSTIASFGEQRRVLLDAKDIPKVFVDALIAVEDADFRKHSGIDVSGIARAAWNDLKTLSLAQGASTITQQLARNLFLKPEKTARRKVQEMLLALEIEKRYSKEEVLRMYCNQVYMGHGRYGLGAAAEFYFGKAARDLTLPEAATLAGLIQRPEGLSPVRSADRSMRRRNHVLSRMQEEGYIDDRTRSEAQAAPMTLNVRREAVDLAPYFIEEVRRWVQGRLGDEALYTRGLEVRTTLDPKLQALASDAVDRGLRELDKRQGWRGAPSKVPAGASLSTYMPPSWSDGVSMGRVAEAVVVSTSPSRAELRVGTWRASLDAAAIEWTGRTNLAKLVRPGDLVFVRLLGPGSAPGTARVTLEQQPRAEAALVAIEPATGAIRALVGGFDFRRSEFDRAMQARRQAGSAFKPFVYASALLAGRTPSDPLLDIPTVFVERGTWKVYQPENYGNKYYGEITLREALEKSANIASVELLDSVGYPTVIDLARKLGITTALQPYPSLALGAFEVSLLEITSAYAAFANLGVHVEPHLVERIADRQGNALFESRPEVQEALPPAAAFQMTRLMEGVITDGTGAAAASLGRPLAGKTGTTDDFTDAWFVGYTPDLAIGVWVGFDTKKTLGSRETGAHAALPIWQAFVASAYRDHPPVEFPEPAGLSTVAIDRETGLRASVDAGCVSVVSETFVSGTEPTAYCRAAEHAKRRLPHPFHRYRVSDDGALEVPSADLDALLAREPTVHLTADDLLVADAPGDERGPVTIRVRRLLEAPAEPVPPDVLERIDPTILVGKDGRPARVVVLGQARPAS